MELSVNGRQRRAAEISSAAPAAAKKPKAGITFQKSRTDKQEWSQQALTFLQEVNRQDMEQRRKLLEAKQRGSSELDALSNSLKTMDRCQKIAARIMKGDKVPPQDEMYLMDNDPDGYKLALVCRKPKEHPKKWESVLKEDQERNSGGEAAEPVDSSVETAEC